VHEDIKINLFRYLLEGITRDWCRSLTVSSINSLTGFHAAFNLFCKEYFSVSHLYENVVMSFLYFVKTLLVTKRILVMNNFP
jgi:hypothetical protein